MKPLFSSVSQRILEVEAVWEGGTDERSKAETRRYIKEEDECNKTERQARSDKDAGGG